MVASSPPGDPLFDLEHVSVTVPGAQERPPQSILGGVSVQVDRGAALVIVGPSGSGKSTLLRCLNRLVEPTGGRVSFDGRDVQALDPRDLRRRAALVMQTPVVFEGTVRDNLRVRPKRTPGDVSGARLEEALAEVGLAAALLDRDAAVLSGGEKQRVTIARALLCEPEALLLDEPTSALDPPNAALVVEAVSRLRALRQLTIVVVTHQMDLIRRLDGDLLYLVEGRVKAHERAAGSGAARDGALEAFLAGEQASSAADRPS